MDSAKHTNNNDVVHQKPNHHHRRLHKVSSLKFPRNSDASPSSSSSAAASSDRDIPRYTSLRDLKDANGNGYFDHSRNGSGEISIKNRLVKHAASAYLQSTAILIGADRNAQNCFASFRDRISRNGAALCSCWRAYVRDPFMACLRPILRFFSLVAW